MEFYLAGVFTGGAPASPVASSDHAPGRSVTKGVQVSGGACWEGPTSMGIPQLKGAARQGAAAEIKVKIAPP